MALCAGIDSCSCVLTSSTLTITGTGTVADPYMIEGGSLTGVATYAALPDPSAMPNGAAFLVEEANEVAIVRSGKYFIPGQKLYELTGSLSTEEAVGTVGRAFSVEAVSPAAPLRITNGSIRMRPFFHPAQFTCYAIRPFDRDPLLGIVLHEVDVTVGGEPATFELLTEFERWYNDTDNETTMPVGRGQNTGDTDAIIDPFVLSTGAMSFQYNVTLTDSALISPSYMAIGLNWSIVE